MPRGYAKSKHKALYNSPAKVKKAAKPRVKLLPRFRCVVEFILPAGAKKADAMKFVEDAVICEVGARHGSDPMSELVRDTIHVKRFRTQK